MNLIIQNLHYILLAIKKGAKTGIKYVFCLSLAAAYLFLGKSVLAKVSIYLIMEGTNEDVNNSVKDFKTFAKKKFEICDPNDVCFPDSYYTRWLS